MVRIIQAQHLGPRPSLRSNRQPNRDRSGEIETQGLERLAMSVLDIAAGVLAPENKFSYANAKSNS